MQRATYVVDLAKDMLDVAWLAGVLEQLVARLQALAPAVACGGTGGLSWGRRCVGRRP